MIETIKPSSPYDPDKFIDREQEIDQIIALLQQSRPRIRAVVIDGDRGAGKTWLSLHLHRIVFRKEINGLTSWLFSLWSPGENYQPWGDKPQGNEYFVQENERLKIDGFLSIIINSLSIELPPNPVLIEKVDAIRSYVQNHPDERFALILDSAYESDWSSLGESLLGQIETHFLGNLLTLNNFFVIVTGRGRPYPWKIPYLIEAIHFGLGKFSITQIQEQLKRFNLSSILLAQDIYNIGEGWPLFTEHLARAKDRIEALDIAAKILFAVVPVHERLQIRKYFEALCPLDGFGEMEAALMVEIYEKNDKQDGRAICKKMNETRLISWKDGRYVMTPPVQKILEQYLPLQNPRVWIDLHCAAYNHFERQYKKQELRRFQPVFEKQMEFHAQALFEAGVRDPHTCPA
jgi:hypothetical protein